MRLVAFVGLGLSIPGAGFLLFAGVLAEDFERFGSPEPYPGEVAIAAGGVGVVAGLLAIYGLAVHARRRALVGAGIQALAAAVFLLWALAERRIGDDTWIVAALVGVIVIDVLAVVSAMRAPEPRSHV